MKRLAIIPMIGCLILGLHQQARAECLSEPSIASLCESGGLIIEGTWLGGDRVAVTRVWKAPASAPKDIKELKVVGLDGLTRVPGFLGDPATKSIVTKNVALFLQYDEKSRAWTPLDTFGRGSCGVFWFDETTCYGYAQLVNPGGYSLLAGVADATGSERRIPATPQVLRRQIEYGCAASKRFQEDLALSDPDKRAEALVRYFLPRTTPDATGSHLPAAEKAVRQMGKDAVPAIIKAIQASQPKEEIHHLLTPLWSMGPDAAAAKPILLEVLARKDQNAGSVIVALETIGDPANAPHIRPFLRGGDPFNHYIAARALAKLGDKQSFAAIAELIPSQIKPQSIYEVKDLLNYLHALDPAQAHPLASKVGADPAMAPVRDQIEALKQR